MRKLPYVKLLVAFTFAWCVSAVLHRSPIMHRVTLLKENRDISTLLFSPDSSFLVTGAEREQEYLVWNTRTGRTVKKVMSPSAITRPTVFSPDSKHLIASTGRCDNGTTIWNGILNWNLDDGTSQQQVTDASFATKQNMPMFSSASLFFWEDRLLGFSSQSKKTWDWHNRKWT